MTEVDHLAAILERKRREIARRKRHRTLFSRVVVASSTRADPDRGALALDRLRRPVGSPLRVIAEVKLKSPSAGLIKQRTPGVVTALAREYAAAGASAVSVLCDGLGFGGSVLDLRRAAHAVAVPVLFKEFVIDPVQVSVARAAGAHMVLLLVRALDAQQLKALVGEVLRQGMAPVVEAANIDEVEVALGTAAAIIGVNARDLRTFEVDSGRAHDALAHVAGDRIAVHMSGIRSAADFKHLSAHSRADALLIGEALMRDASPGALLRQWLQTS